MQRLALALVLLKMRKRGRRSDGVHLVISVIVE